MEVEKQLKLRSKLKSCGNLMVGFSALLVAAAGLATGGEHNKASTDFANLQSADQLEKSEFSTAVQYSNDSVIELNATGAPEDGAAAGEITSHDTWQQKQVGRAEVMLSYGVMKRLQLNLNVGGIVDSKNTSSRKSYSTNAGESDQADRSTGSQYSHSLLGFTALLTEHSRHSVKLSPFVIDDRLEYQGAVNKKGKKLPYGIDMAYGYTMPNIMTATLGAGYKANNPAEFQIGESNWIRSQSYSIEGSLGFDIGKDFTLLSGYKRQYQEFKPGSSIENIDDNNSDSNKSVAFQDMVTAGIDYQHDALQIKVFGFAAPERETLEERNADPAAENMISSRQNGFGMQLGWLFGKSSAKNREVAAVSAKRSNHKDKKVATEQGKKPKAVSPEFADDLDPAYDIGLKGDKPSKDAFDFDKEYKKTQETKIDESYVYDDELQKIEQAEAQKEKDLEAQVRRNEQKRHQEMLKNYENSREIREKVRKELADEDLEIEADHANWNGLD